MRTAMWFVGLALLASPLAVAQDKKDEKKFELEKGFVLLFNGKDLDGWVEVGKKDAEPKATLKGKTKAFDGRFSVAEGRLVIDPAVKGDRYIETAREFAKDVHIKFDFKAGEKCNNDLFLRGTKFDVVLPKKDADLVKQGQWQAFEIVVVGEEIEHKIDGKTARKAKLNAKAKASPFKIRAEFGAIELKNVRAKE